MEDNQDLEYKSEREELLLFCNSQLQLIELFMAIDELRTNSEGADSELDCSNSMEQAVADLLHETLSEARELLQYVEKYRDKCLKQNLGPPTQCPQRKPLGVSDFLGCFSVELLL